MKKSTVDGFWLVGKNGPPLVTQAHFASGRGGDEASTLQASLGRTDAVVKQALLAPLQHWLPFLRTEMKPIGKRFGCLTHPPLLPSPGLRGEAT